MELFTIFLTVFVALIDAATNAMIFAENWTNIIQMFASCAIAVFAGLGTRAAYKGLNSWQNEHAGRAAHDAARKLLINLHKISEFSTILSSNGVAINHLKAPPEDHHETEPKSVSMTMRLDHFIDTIEDKNKYYEFVTMADAINRTLGRHTVNPPLHDLLSKFMEEKKIYL